MTEVDRPTPVLVVGDRALVRGRMRDDPRAEPDITVVRGAVDGVEAAYESGLVVPGPAG